ncbi:MAG: hypothetical protein HYX60_02705 [Legionella longbeachae]|nr:hypothetical protein [Legionella longbeachae]
MNRSMLVIIGILFSLINMQNSYASNYRVCMKWVIGALGVECESKLDNTSVGSLIFFEKIADETWQYHSTNDKYPFETILPGPGLEGPTVTNYGRLACEQFCMKYRG